MDRTILHCDLNGFYASVECLFDPALNAVPMAVAGSPDDRHGIILAKNELAKKYKVQTAETIWQARRKCPDLVLIPPHHEEYARYSRLVNRIYHRFTDLVEPFGIDESWLDITDVYHAESGGKTADTIRRAVREELGLTISVGVSFNKVFAKLGSDYKKPDATTVITRENFREILYPLPVSALLYVGKATNAALERMSIRTIGDLAGSGLGPLEARLGKMGRIIWAYAGGLDDSPVRSTGDNGDIKSIGNGLTFRRNLTGMADIRTGVYALSDEVARRMRKHGVKCRVVEVIIKDPQLKSISRQVTLDNPTHLAREIAEEAIGIIQSAWDLRAPIRMLTVTGANLVGENAAYEQTDLFVDSVSKEKMEKLESAVDQIRTKYGKDSISLGGALHSDLGISHFPDKNK